MPAFSDQIRQYQLHLINEKRLEIKSILLKMAAIKFFYVHVIRRSFRRQELPFPKSKNKLPVILSQEEISKIIDTALDLYHRAILMALYSTGMRCSELVNLKIADIDSKRMMIRIYCGFFLNCPPMEEYVKDVN
jgi:integrase/recombinase XerD